MTFPAEIKRMYLTMISRKPNDLQRLYKVIECPAIFIFYIIRIVYDNKKMLSRSNISHVHIYSMEDA